VAAKAALGELEHNKQMLSQQLLWIVAPARSQQMMPTFPWN
jgi:hypothetical protein